MINIKTKKIRIYDGALGCSNGCGGCGGCPAVDYFPGKNTVILSDPAKPDRGKFSMTVQDYNKMLSGAKQIKAQFTPK